MFRVISFMIMGIILGYSFKNYTISFINQLINVLIWTLLFILGLEVGSNSDIIKNLKFVGIDAFVISVGAILGSVLMAWILWKSINRYK
ncbi:MAG: LysO family transporter [Bacteroidales bacterium]